MTDDVLSCIHNRMDAFSKGQKRIAAYILENYEKAAFQTASAIGKAADVSESTVVRFAALLGYAGFPQMQEALRALVMNRLTATQRMEIVQERIVQEDILSAMLQEDVERIRRTAEESDRAAFSGAVEMLLSAQRLFIVGVRSSAPIAAFLSYYLRYLFDDVRLLTGDAETLEQAARIRPQDVMIGISFPRYCSLTLRAMELAGQAGAGTICLTDRLTAPIAGMADYALIAKSGMASFVDSMTAPMSVINALLVAVASSRRAETAQNFEKLEEIWDTYHVYEKNDG